MSWPDNSFKFAISFRGPPDPGPRAPKPLRIALTYTVTIHKTGSQLHSQRIMLWSAIVISMVQFASLCIIAWN